VNRKEREMASLEAMENSIKVIRVLEAKIASLEKSIQELINMLNKKEVKSASKKK